MRMRLYFCTEEEARRFYDTIDAKFYPHMIRTIENHEVQWIVMFNTTAKEG